jgi:hypothetical protein
LVVLIAQPKALRIAVGQPGANRLTRLRQRLIDSEVPMDDLFATAPND